MRHVRTLRALLTVLAVLLLASPSYAQSGTITGTVTDSTGGVLPGVTVEASSPALIEGTRTAVTDGSGIYRLVDLRLGEYTVVFTLPGFTTVRREGVQLNAGVTASVNAELRVSELQETITVTGATPLVDVQSATQHTALTRQMLDELPTGRQFGNYGVLIPGVVTNIQDVGGSSSNVSTTNIMGVHGSNANEMPMIIDGMRYGNVFGTGGGASGPYIINNGMVEEMAVETSGAGADAEVGGFRSNVILKQGGNFFSGSFYGGGFTDALVADNIDDALRQRGALSPSAVTRQWDTNFSFGGPVVRDRFWFYGSYRNYGSNQEPTGAYRALDPTAVVFTPPTIVGGVIVAGNSADLNNTPVNELRNQNFNARFTIQTSTNSKLSAYFDQMPRCVCANGLSATTTYEATTYYHNDLNMIQQLTWNWTISNRLLLEVGETFKPDSWQFDPQEGIDPSLPPSIDQGTGIISRSRTFGLKQTSFQHNGKAVLTYVTGSSSLKTGAQWFQGSRTAQIYPPDMFWILRNGVPQAITQNAAPRTAEESLDLNLGLFVQEQYTWRDLTLNAGLRFDSLKGSIPEQTIPASRWVPALTYPGVDNLPNWKDINPRFGLAYDIFGDGRTALKWSLGRFVEAQAAGFAEAVNPARVAATTSGSRQWTDTNGNLNPDCDLTNYAANLECGQILNPAFGTPAVSAFRYDPGASEGWGNRIYNWEMMAGFEHQLTDGFSMDVSYNRRSYGNFRVFQAAGVSPQAYDEFCVTTPVDPMLPGGGGQRVCGFYNIKPQFAGQDATNILIAKARDVAGDIKQYYDGVDVTLTLRLPDGILLQGGTSTGRSHTDWCGAVVGRPDIRGLNPYVAVSGAPSGTVNEFSRTDPYCKSAHPFQTQVKLAGVYPLPWNVVTSFTYQSLVYPQEFYGGFGGILAGRSFTNAEISPSLDRNLTGASSTVLQMIPAASQFGDRLHQIDFRVTRRFTWNDLRIQPQLDLYNLTNANDVLTINSTYGARWLQPTAILLGRVVKFGVQVDF